MNMRIIVAALIGSVVSFFLGWVVFGMLLDPYYQSNMVKYNGLVRGMDDMRLHGIYLAQLCWCGLIAYVFGVLGNVKSFMKGAIAGGIIFGLAFAGVDLMMWSGMNLFGFKMVVIDALANGIFGGLISGVIALILGWGGNKS
ncbi:MAG: hypothetical protein ACKVOR_13320 [Flavobacteriales bacterium]